MNAPLMVKLPIRTVVSVTISWSHRKYHGALAGLGVTRALAASSSGDRTRAARMLITAKVPSVTIEARRVRSGTALTVAASFSRVVVVTVGAVPRATPSSV